MRGFMRTEAMELKSSSDSKSKRVSQSEILAFLIKEYFIISQLRSTPWSWTESHEFVIHILSQ